MLHSHYLHHNQVMLHSHYLHHNQVMLHSPLLAPQSGHATFPITCTTIRSCYISHYLHHNQVMVHSPLLAPKSGHATTIQVAQAIWLRSRSHKQLLGSRKTIISHTIIPVWQEGALWHNVPSARTLFHFSMCHNVLICKHCRASVL